METITELFAELQEACREIPASLPRILEASQTLGLAIAREDDVIPEDIFDGITAEARKSILLSYVTTLHTSLERQLSHQP